MKKLFGKIAMYLALFIGVITLGSCSSSSFAKQWSGVTFTDGNDKYVSVLSLDEAKTKKNNKDSFVLIVASPSDTKAVEAMNVLFATMVELGYETENRIYCLDSTEAISKGSVLGNYRTSLGLKDVKDVSGAAFVALGYSNGLAEFDTSNKDLASNIKFSPSGSSNFSSVDYYALSQYICLDFE